MKKFLQFCYTVKTTLTKENKNKQNTKQQQKKENIFPMKINLRICLFPVLLPLAE